MLSCCDLTLAHDVTGTLYVRVYLRREIDTLTIDRYLPLDIYIIQRQVSEFLILQARLG